MAKKSKSDDSDFVHFYQIPKSVSFFHYDELSLCLSSKVALVKTFGKDLIFTTGI